MSSFNPDTFLNTETNQANATAYTPCPEGEFTASIKTIKPRVLTDGRAVLDLTWIVDDEEVRNETGMAEPSVRQTLWLDITEFGGLDEYRQRAQFIDGHEDSLYVIVMR